MSAFAGVGTALVLYWLLDRASRREDELHGLIDSQQQEKKVIFEFLHDLGEAFTEHIDKPYLLNIILRCAMRVCEARGGAVYLWNNSQRTELKAVQVNGIFPPPFPVDETIADKLVTRHEYLESFIRGEPIPKNSNSVVAQVAQSGRSLVVYNAEGDNRFPVFKDESLRVVSYIAVPLHYRDEKLGVMAVANREGGKQFSASDFDVVKSVADTAAYALHSAQVYSQLAEKKKIDHDLQVAREIQRILLPASAPKLENFEICAINLPAQHVSGDYYDFIQVDPTKIGIVIADVSGKGIPASLIMAMCRSVLRSKAVGCPSPAQVLSAVNRQLQPDIREDMFITMVYIILDTATKQVRMARAGHEAPLICTNNFELVQPISAPGMALGIDSGEVFDEVIQEVVIAMQPKDTIIVYTDGINEAMDAHGEEFGREHLKTALKTAGQKGVEFLARNIVERVQRFSSGQPQNDDITLAAIQRL
ncbi:MAG: PP2C family protein-serine/threonine phosphatase [Candidatus Methylacidiphilales bacterium]|nr:GAF domain-containing SpoIIE family protein phosphatase [Candidatus Methylacidiphilales bacterium]